MWIEVWIVVKAPLELNIELKILNVTPANRKSEVQPDGPWPFDILYLNNKLIMSLALEWKLSFSIFPIVPQRLRVRQDSQNAERSRG